MNASQQLIHCDVFIMLFFNTGYPVVTVQRNYQTRDVILSQVSF